MKNNKQIVIKIFVIATLQLLFVFSLKAQQFNNWHFPDSNSITFKSGSPVFLKGTSINNTNSSCASISDRVGNTLFYTNGINVWDKNNSPIPELCASRDTLNEPP
jgi:hypothetical protein